ncbi:hypothetical protein HKD37_08G022546 [Glycine soja]
MASCSNTSATVYLSVSRVLNDQCQFPRSIPSERLYLLARMGRHIDDSLLHCGSFFQVRKLKEVMSTEQPCDLAYEFGDGLHDIKELPLGFPRPVKHPYPFNDQIVVYVRYLGPGVSVGQAWQEGTKLEQVPHKLYGEILMVKDCTSLREDQ